MVSAAEDAQRVLHHRTFADAAGDAGIEHLVYLSFYRAAPDAELLLARDHWATEEHIRSTGISHTFLRDNLYAEVMPALVGEDGVIRGPAGEGRVSPVSQDDVADAGTAVLLDPGAHVGRTYDLTGPEALTFAEIADLASSALGRPVRYVDETIEQAHASRAQYDAPDRLVRAWISTYTAIAKGELDDVSSDIERLTGHKPTSLSELLRSQP